MPAAAAPVGGGRRASAPTAPGLIRLSRVSLFAGLSPARLAWLEKRLLVVRWHYGTVRPTALVRPDHLYVVREGRLALFERAASGHQVMIAVLDPRIDLLDARGRGRAGRRRARGRSRLATRGSCAGGARGPRAPARLELAEAFSERVAMLRATAAVLAEMRVEDRLRARVLQLAGSHGVATPVGARLDLGLTHAQWGLLVGAARESVTLAFGRLRGRGELSVEGRTITIPWETVDSWLQDGSPRG
jgi:hypothetical protein